jgi:MFS family permease
MDAPTSPFRRSLPVTATAFINKSGTIGLSIIPLLLVERHVGAGASALVLGAIKTAGLAGVLLGGWLCDRLGLRATLLLSFLVSGIGMAPLPFVGGALVLGACAALSQLGTSFYYASGRLLVTQLVRPEERAEAIAWQRTSSNLAQILSYSLGAFFGRFGTMFLLLFDAFTSFLATAVGAKILPDPKAAKAAEGASATDGGTHFDFYRGALIVAMFSVLYELWAAASAAECKVIFGGEGLAIFSELMVVNTVLCALFSVVAARHVRRAEFSMPVGLLLLTLGCVATFATAEKSWFFLGALLVTLGEILFNALAGMVLIVTTPTAARQGSVYSQGVLLQFAGRILGASAAFPLVVNGSHPVLATLVAAGLALLLCAVSWRVLARAN